MVTANIFDHEKRKRSFEIVAEICGLTPRQRKANPIKSVCCHGGTPCETARVVGPVAFGSAGERPPQNLLGHVPRRKAWSVQSPAGAPAS